MTKQEIINEIKKCELIGCGETNEGNYSEMYEDDNSGVWFELEYNGNDENEIIHAYEVNDFKRTNVLF